MPTSVFAGAEGCGGLINNRPCQTMLSHADKMGQIVPYVKDDVSREAGQYVRYVGNMSEWLDETRFNEELCARVQRLRVERGWTQQQMATAIGVPFERYKKYEVRSPLPPYLIPRFAQQVDREPGYIVTGQEARRARGPRTLVRTGTDG